MSNTKEHVWNWRTFIHSYSFKFVVESIELLPTYWYIISTYTCFFLKYDI